MLTFGEMYKMEGVFDWNGHCKLLDWNKENVSDDSYVILESVHGCNPKS